MTIVQKQLAKIRRIQKSQARQEIGDELSNPLDLILEVQPGTPFSNFNKSMKQVLPGIDFEIDTVFVNEDNPHFFCLRFSQVSFDDLEVSYFELCYYLRERLNLVSAEIDLETNFHPWQSEFDGFEKIAEAKSGSLVKWLCFENKEPPPDKAWALRRINLDKALQSYKVSGRGIKLAQIDTGLANHVEFDDLVIDDSLGFNLYDRSKGAIDPLTDRPFDQKGHGVATSSVIVSQGGIGKTTTTEPGHITGVANEVDFTPYRATRSVIKIKQSRIARAVDLARQNREHIITMSIGGITSCALEKALERAVKENIIVMAAAGNCTLWMVVFPAASKNCIAVAATNNKDKKWRGSSWGQEVDFSAPGENVWHAVRKDKNGSDTKKVKGGQGTSFAVALSAGVASLWLQKFGRDKLIASLKPHECLQDRFRYAAQSTARVPRKKWPSHQLGAGILNALDILDCDGRKSQNTSSKTIANDDLHTSQGERLLSLFAQEFKETNITDSQISHLAGVIATFSQEIIWRIMRENQKLVRENDVAPIQPASTRLQSLLTAYPELAQVVP